MSRPLKLHRALGDLLEEQARNVTRAAGLLNDLLAAHPDHAGPADRLRGLCDESDAVLESSIRECAVPAGALARYRRRAAHAQDTVRVAEALADMFAGVVEAGRRVDLYRVQAPMEQAGRVALVLAAAGQEIGTALRAVRAGERPTVAVARLREHLHSGRDMVDDAVGSLFAEGVDPMVVIAWKDIFASLGRSLQAGERVFKSLDAAAS